jgi:hypothetical protein
MVEILGFFKMMQYADSQLMALVITIENYYLEV